ncbi:MAG: imidazolonepropionase [Oscillospiraceae bacterium]|nr:imidazolonepropionase [Oscillospiraceae bacterium]
MPRKYTRIKTFEKEILEMVKNGSTQREIAEHFGFKDKEVVRGFLRRERRNQKKIITGTVPKPKGRPRKDGLLSQQSVENELKRLKMENELLRDFLRLAERR